MMYFQDASMLEFQRRLQDQMQKNNLQNLFQVETIPKDTQLRETVDTIPSQKLFPIFNDFFRLLQRGNQLQHFQFLEEGYLTPIDGSQYFCSEAVSCPLCLTKVHKNGTIGYPIKFCVRLLFILKKSSSSLLLRNQSKTVTAPKNRIARPMPANGYWLGFGKSIQNFGL